ncbi:rhamnan synthesis F family protein [Methylobacterium fujisawaense]
MNEYSLTDLDPVWYLQRYADVAASGMTASDHFTAYGRAEGRIPNAEAESLLNADDFDPSWYAAYYADSIEQDCDPILHYLSLGKARRYFPNEAARRREALIEAFDPIWYLCRNRDVAESGMEPLDHFLTYGHAEGRSPNERAESRARWRGWFDPEWYTARYDDVAASGLSPLEHYLRLGIYAGRAPNTAAEDRAAWDGTFDAQWYTSRYDDIASSGLSPLEHFITYGIIAGRKPNASVVSEHEPVDYAKLELLKAGAVSNRVVLFVTHAPGGQIKPHVVEHLAAYKKSRISVVLVAASDASQIQITPSVSELADVIVRRDNTGYDFAAWAHFLRKNPDLFQSDIIFLANDSVFGPLTQDAFDGMLIAVDTSPADIVGLTDNYQLGWHLQSYFLAIKKRALIGAPFRKFIDGVVSYKRKNDVIAEYETKFTHYMINHGLKCLALYKSTNLSNTTLDSWRELTRAGMPYVKASLFNRCTVKVDITGWREHLNQLGYETANADQSLAQTCLAAKADDVSDYARGRVSQRNALHNLHQFFSTGQSLTLKNSDRPILSVILIAHNQAEFLYPFLQMFSELRTVRDVELSILDCASTDDTSYLSRRVKGCIFHRMSATASVAELLSEAVQVARGQRILLLRHTLYVNAAMIELALSCETPQADFEVLTGAVKDNSRHALIAYPPLSDSAHCNAPIDEDLVVARRADDDAINYMMLFDKYIFQDNALWSVSAPTSADHEGSLRSLLEALDLRTGTMRDITILTV